MEAVTFIVLFGLLIFSIWNWISLRRWMRLANDGTEKKDAHYYELKFQVQFLVALFTVVSATIAFLGYNTFNSIYAEVSKKLDVIDSLETHVSKLEGFITEFEKTALEIKTNAPALQMAIANAKSLENKINTINSKNILKQNYYIVPVDLPAKPSDRLNNYQFSSLRTTSGDKLPAFKSPPIMLPTYGSGVSFFTYSVTSTSFGVGLEGNDDGYDVTKPITVYVLVFEK